MVDNNREYITTANTVGYWKLNWNANGVVWGNGTATNITWSDWKIGSGSATWNWTSSKIALASNLGWNNSWTWTMSVWAKTSTLPSSWQYKNIIRLGEATTYTDITIWYANVGWVWKIFYWKWRSNVQGQNEYTYTLSNWAWTNLICVCDNAWTQLLYINWVLAATGSTRTWNGTSLWTNNAWELFVNTAITTPLYFWWQVDEAIVENRGWTATEIADYYQQTKWLYWVGQYLWAWSWVTKWLYHLNWNCSDDSWNGFDWTPTSITFVDWRNGNSAASFNGSTSKITAPLIYFNATWKFTYSTWIKLATTESQYLATFNQQIASPYNTNALIYWFTSWLVEWYNTPRTTVISWFTDTTKWHHICVTYNWTALVWYLDWVLNTSTNVSLTLPSTSETTVAYLWNSNSSDAVNWLMDETIIENRAWTAAEVRKYYSYSKWQFANL